MRSRCGLDDDGGWTGELHLAARVDRRRARRATRGTPCDELADRSDVGVALDERGHETRVRRRRGGIAERRGEVGMPDADEESLHRAALVRELQRVIDP